MYQSRLLAAITEHCRRHAAWTLLVGLLLGVLSLGAAHWRLGITTDTDKLFADSLPWRQRQIAFDDAFPQFRDLLVVVIDSAIPEEADVTAGALARVLEADHAHFNLVVRPDASPYL